MQMLSLFCVITLLFVIHRLSSEADFVTILREHVPFDGLQNKYHHAAYYLNIVRDQVRVGRLLHIRGADAIAMWRDHDPCVDRRLDGSDD